ncbi:MAG: hypothetical protein RDU20_14080 [Desulfomonilaceae bacterium]|nr:hypothetical protein [Desulfomonilaceae bacterium]
MIVDNPASHFVFVYHPGIFHGKAYTVYDGRPMTNGEVLENWGKWLVLGEPARLEKLARDLDPYVERERIPVIKYDREPSRNLGIDESVMMVYCDKRCREAVWEILEDHGIKLKAWVSERETMEMWLPGGLLLERWIESKGFDEDLARAVREDARAAMGRVFEMPDEIFSPWAQ